MEQGKSGGQPAAAPVVNDVGPPVVTTQMVNNIPVKAPDGSLAPAAPAAAGPAAPAVPVPQTQSSHPVKAMHQRQPSSGNHSWAAILLAVLVAGGLAVAAVMAMR